MNKTLQQALDLADLSLDDQVIMDAYHHSMIIFVEIYKGKKESQGSLNDVDSYCRNLRELFFEVRDGLIEGDIVLNHSVKPSPFKPLSQLKSSEEIPKKSKSVEVSTPEVEKSESLGDEMKGLTRRDQVKFLINEKGISSPSKIAKILGTNPSYVHRLKKQIINE